MLPTGVWLVCHLYERTRVGFSKLVVDGVVRFPTPAAARSFLRDIDRSVNRPWIFWASAGMSLFVNALIMTHVAGSWHDAHGGPAAWWFRAFTFVNLLMLFQVLFKGVFIAKESRHVFDHDVLLQPLHPDGCGGLKPLGDISKALNFFVSLIGLYLSVVAIVGRTPIGHPLFAPAVVAFIVLAVYLFFAPLWKAHDRMAAEKERVLHALSQEFQHTYEQVARNLSARGILLEDAQKIGGLEQMYRIASNMPVWPLDVKILTQFAGAVLVPPVLKVANALIQEWVHR